MAQSAAPHIATNGLVFYIDAGNPLSYPGSGTTVYDLSVKGHNASLLGSTSWNSAGYFQIRYSTADCILASFNENVLQGGGNAPANGTYQANLNTSWSLEAFWQNISAPNSGESFIIGRQGCHGGIYTFQNGSNTDVYQAIKSTQCWTGAVNAYITTLVPNQMCHSVMTYSNGIIKSYINGNYITSNTLPYSTYGITGYGSNMFIGGFNNSSYYSNNCNIYIARAYNRDLTAAEVAINYAAHKGRLGLS